MTLRVAAALACALLAAACQRGPGAEERCLDCHRGIEHTSASHAGCTSCHGGDAAGRTAADAHRGIYGLGNPSHPGRWERGCGSCHAHEVERVRSSQMYTNAGMIARVQETWEGETPGVVYASRDGSTHDTAGRPLAHASVAGLDHVSGELYRKFCARCHVGRRNEASDGSGHPAGCAACHFPYGPKATYTGGDPTMRGKAPHGASHTLRGLPPMEACLQCHHRSGRTGLAYTGLDDGNNALVPTRGGQPGPVSGSDQRSFVHIAADVHFEAGMECIDCHTSREVMGDGYAARDMHGQLEIRCEDCHGDGVTPPRFATVARDGDLPLRESRQYAFPVRPGTRVALTSRGRPFSNVFDAGGAVMVATKRLGKRLRSPVVTGTPEHRIAGHGRLACASCHSRTVVQCYGCHTTYDRRERGFDFVQGRDTAGAFSETEDVRRLRPFPLAVDGTGRITPVTPGCQTFVTVVEADGTVTKREDVARYRGRRQLRFAPLSGHNTGRRAVGCAECHGDPAYLGFGQHTMEAGAIRGTLLCERNPKKPLDGFLAMDGTRVVSHAAISREGARPLDPGEVRRVLTVNLCLVCHDRARDPVWLQPMQLAALDDPLHRKLLATR